MESGQGTPPHSPSTALLLREQAGYTGPSKEELEGEIEQRRREPRKVSGHELSTEVFLTKCSLFLSGFLAFL